MADEKSIVKMNKMIHKNAGASFLVVYVIYVSLVYKIARKLRHVYSPDIPYIYHLLVRIQGGLYLFHYVLDNLNWLLFVFLSNLIINLMYNIKNCTLMTSTSSEFKNDFDKTR